MIDDNWRHRLMEARENHRAGRLDVARAAYDLLLSQAPEDTEVRGLLGVLELQEGRPEEAEALLRQAVGTGGEAPVYLRNLNNLLALLQQAGNTGAARKLVAGDLPDWPEGMVPNASERRTVLSLCRALRLLDRAPAARVLLEQAIPEPDDDAEVLGLMGQILLALSETAPAAAALEHAAQLAPDDCQLLIGLSYAQGQLGQPEAARAAAKRIALLRPFYSAESQPSQKATVLVLNPMPWRIENPDTNLRKLHFSANYGAQVADCMHDNYRFVSLFGDLPADELPAQFPQVDIVMNNIVNSEPMNAPGRLDIVRANAERPGRPVINHPLQVFQTTRQKNALWLENVANVRVPRVARYQRDRSPLDAIVSDIGQRFQYPVILREVAAHMSAYSLLPDRRQTAVLVNGAAELREHIEMHRWPEFYAVEFVDLKKPGGYFRKIRVVFIDDQIVVTNGGYLDQWMVSGWRYRPIGIKFYRAHPECIEDLRRIVSDPIGVFGDGFMQTLAAIRDRIPLDMFGIDFDVDLDGRVVLFEANAAMAFLELHEPLPELALSREPYERINDAFRRAVDRRIGAAGQIGEPVSGYPGTIGTGGFQPHPDR